MGEKRGRELLGYGEAFSDERIMRTGGEKFGLLTARELDEIENMLKCNGIQKTFSIYAV